MISEKWQGHGSTMANENNGAKLKRLLTVQEAAEYLGIAPGHLYNCISANAKRPFPVKPKRIGGAVRFDIKELDRYIEAL
jgi:excisionase family DNA binding protein